MPLLRFSGSNLDISKFKMCPGWEMRTTSPPSTAAIVTLPPELDSSPVLITVPPVRVKNQFDGDEFIGGDYGHRLFLNWILKIGDQISRQYFLSEKLIHMLK